MQDASGATLADGKLTLTDVAPSTIYFSDRPERIAGHMATSTFVASWDQGDDSFAENPPNAALSILGTAAPDDIVVELSHPPSGRWDPDLRRRGAGR